jgi:hypothetical protein
MMSPTTFPAKQRRIRYNYDFRPYFKVYAVLGLGFSNPSSAPVLSLFDTLVASNKFNDSFSLCLGDRPYDLFLLHVGPSVGHLVIGGIDPTFVGNTTYTVPTRPQSYDIQIKQFSVGKGVPSSRRLPNKD